jgi:hypothetical protein
MKIFLLSIFIFLFYHPDSIGQNDWWKFYDQGRLSECILTSDSSVIAVGSGFSVLKTNLQGDTIWHRSFPKLISPMSSNEAWSVVETPDHFYLVCGFGGTLSNYTQRLVKIDSMGNLIWERDWLAGIATDVKVNSRGLYVVTLKGLADSLSIHEIDTSGNISWQTSIYLPRYPVAEALVIDSVDQIYVCGSYSLPSSEFIGFLIKLDSLGSILDTTLFTSPPYGVTFKDLTICDQSKIYVCGASWISYNDQEGLVVEFNTSGDTIRSKILSTDFYPYSIHYQQSSNILFLDGFDSDSTMQTSVYINSLDTVFNTLSVINIDSTGSEKSTGFALHESGIYICGSSIISQIEYKWIYFYNTQLHSGTDALLDQNNVLYYSDGIIYYNLTNCYLSHLILYDVSGKYLKEIKIDCNEGKSQVGDLPFGMYLAVLTNKGYSYIDTIKFIVN